MRVRFTRPSPAAGRARSGAAALEFAIVVGLLFTIFLGMIEIGRGMMAMGAINNAARVGARAGSVTNGDFTSISNAVTASLDNAGISVSPCPVVVTVNGIAVTDDASFKSAAVGGSTVSVQVQVPYSKVSWFPAGSSFFLSSGQKLTAIVVMRREG